MCLFSFSCCRFERCRCSMRLCERLGALFKFISVPWTTQFVCVMLSIQTNRFSAILINSTSFQLRHYAYIHIRYHTIPYHTLHIILKLSFICCCCYIYCIFLYVVVVLFYFELLCFALLCYTLLFFSHAQV